MDVSSTTTAATTATAPAVRTAKTAATDYDNFLTLLTVQITNQDPLSPMSSDDFAVQLATFSGVEQQTKTNTLLEKQLALNSQGALAQMVGWVGKVARIAAPVHFDGLAPVTLSPNPGIGADKAVLVVRNAQNVELSRTEIPVTSADYEWQGLDSAGNPLPEGIYDLTLESFADDKLLGKTPVEYFGTIQEIRSSTGGVTALFNGGVEVSTALVTALRDGSN